MSLFRSSMFIFKNSIAQCSLTNLKNVRYIKRYVAPTLRELQKRRDKIGEEPEKHRSTFLEWNYQAEIYAFGKRLNEDFDEQLLKRALTTRSYVSFEQSKQKNEENSPQVLEDNNSFIIEGQEFISQYIKEYLKESFPLLPTDGISAICDFLTSDSILSSVADHIGLKDLILTPTFPVDVTTRASAFKSVVTALLHSSGENQASLFVRDFVVSQLNGRDIYDIWNIKEPMALLKELIGEYEARLCNQSGVNTILATYQVGLYSEKQMVGKGWGESIEIAKEMAARDALKHIFKTTDAMPALQFKKPPVTSSHDFWKRAEV